MQPRATPAMLPRMMENYGWLIYALLGAAFAAVVNGAIEANGSTQAFSATR